MVALAHLTGGDRVLWNSRMMTSQGKPGLNLGPEADYLDCGFQ